MVKRSVKRKAPAAAKSVKRSKRRHRAKAAKTEEEMMQELAASGFRRFEEADLTAERATLLFSINQFLWVRMSAETRTALAEWDAQLLREHYYQNASFFERRWSVENPGSHTREDLTAPKVLPAFPDSSFYCSAVLQGDAKALKRFLGALPFATPSLLKEAKHDDGAWLFLGANRGEAPLLGRAEHVDKVGSSGTWHIQVKGSKTWLVRPDALADVWEGCPPELQGLMHAERSTTGGRAWRLRIVAEAGDLLVLNTSAWYHHTELEKAKEISMSVARDFHLEEDGASMPAAGEADHEQCDKFNSPDSLDPRMIASRSFGVGEVVLIGAEIPDTLPCSATPNCELITGKHGDGLLRSLQRIASGDVLIVAADSNTEYEEVEVDFSTGSGVITRCGKHMQSDD